MLFQNPDLQFCMNTLREEMRFCLENIRVPAGEMDARIDRAAAELGIAPLLDRTLSTLSGGEKQKAALSCLYVMESRCILLDESFANLDHEAAAQLLEMLLRMKTSGRTILAIDHKADLWLEAADEIILLEEGGKVAARGIHCKNLPEHRADFERLGLFYRAPGRSERPARWQRASRFCSSGVSASARGCPPAASGAARCTTHPFWCRMRTRISRRAV